MSFLLDTNILSAHLRKPGGLGHRFIQYSGRLYTSSICLGELFVWAYGRDDPAPTLAAIRTLLEYEVSVIAFDEDCAEEFGRLRSELRKQGISVNTIDLLVASVALVYDLTLVTHNTADFQHIPGPRLQDWLAP
jgi:tRNA(fMet)-specific endonuclease VapC